MCSLCSKIKSNCVAVDSSLRLNILRGLIQCHRFRKRTFFEFANKPTLTKTFHKPKIIKSTNIFQQMKGYSVESTKQQNSIHLFIYIYNVYPFFKRILFTEKRFFGKTFAQKPFRNNCLLMAFYDCGFLVRASNRFYQLQATE